MAGTVMMNKVPAGVSTPRAQEATGKRIIVADVGGTYARLGWTQAADAEQVHDYRRYACADHPDLASILRDYAADGVCEGAVVAIAGVLEGDRLINSNLPWAVSVEQTRQAAGLEWVRLINDFEAVANAMPLLTRDTLSPLTRATEATATSPALVLGPGTGLGAALWMEGHPPRVLATEVGQAALAAGNDLEMDIVRRLLRERRHLNNEHVLSGTGLMNLYRCLCELRGGSPLHADAGALVAAAQSGDALALETLQVFCGWLGSLVGDLAIIFGAKVVYLAGGVTAHIPSFLHDGHFLQRYLNKGVMSERLEQVPVWRVEHGQLGLLGAAAWYRQHVDVAATLP
jgi:glucokinase